MHVVNPLLDELRRLQAADFAPAARGRAFEALVARLFRGAHYRVERSVGTARPRQTDLLAVSHEETYLVEVKWRARPATIDDVHSLLARLSQTHTGIAGVLVSYSGFTHTAIEAVENRRDRPVLLIDGEEVARACHQGDHNFRALLRLKRDALLWDGRVAPGAELETGRRDGRFALEVTSTSTYLVDVDGMSLPWIAGPGGFGGFTFSGQINDPDWVAGGGAGVTMHIALRLWDLEGVASALGELTALGWTGGDAHWCIAQAQTNWHGTGPAGLVDALARQQERYLEAGEIHHSEHVAYHDNFQEGFLSMNLEVQASAEPRVWHGALALSLGGVPLDLGPVRELCRTFGAQTSASFRPQIAHALRRQQLPRLSLGAPRAFLVQDSPDDVHNLQWVRGIVIDNPLQSGVEQTELRKRDGHLASILADSALLVCELGSWHPLGQEHEYELHDCRWTITSAAAVLQVTADWTRHPAEDIEPAGGAGEAL